ncbi:MAG: hypothetical protein U1F24_09820 [Alphaproteobacteria bacterium]
MTRFVLSAAALAAILAVPAAASSDEAWAEQEKQVTEACVAASGLKDAKAHTDVMQFDDTVGYAALIVEGEGEGGHMGGEGHMGEGHMGEGHMGEGQGGEGHMEGMEHHAMALCLFDKKTGKASIAEMHHK